MTVSYLVAKLFTSYELLSVKAKLHKKHKDKMGKTTSKFGQLTIKTSTITHKAIIGRQINNILDNMAYILQNFGQEKVAECGCIMMSRIKVLNTNRYK